MGAERNGNRDTSRSYRDWKRKGVKYILPQRMQRSLTGTLVGVGLIALVKHSPPHRCENHSADSFNDRKRHPKELQEITTSHEGAR
jgi:hypothetical protein